MMDYADGIIQIAQLRQQAHSALLARDWAKACDIADELVKVASSLKFFCIYQMKDDDGKL
jgi:hypothetical protein